MNTGKSSYPHFKSDVPSNFVAIGTTVARSRYFSCQRLAILKLFWYKQEHLRSTQLNIVLWES